MQLYIAFPGSPATGDCEFACCRYFPYIPVIQIGTKRRPKQDDVPRGNVKMRNAQRDVSHVWGLLPSRSTQGRFCEPDSCAWQRAEHTTRGPNKTLSFWRWLAPEVVVPLWQHSAF